ncbi:MAG: AI-2E family transporter [Bacillota bacterium]
MGGIMELVITPLLLAVLLAYILAPPVRYLEKQGLSRSTAILTIYVFFASLLLLVCLNLFPSLIKELEELGRILPEYTERLMLNLEDLEGRLQRFSIPHGVRGALDENIRALQGMLGQRLERLALFLLSAVGRIMGLLLVPLFTFYFLRDSDSLKKWLLLRLPPSFRDSMEQTLADVSKTLGAYLRGIIIVSLAVGVMLYLGLLILGVQFSLFLALLNTLLNVVPYFGPLIGAIPVIIIAFLQSPALAWKATLLMIIVQQVESQLIAPRVFGYELGFHPLVVVIALLLGGIYLGFFGLVFIVPLTAVFIIFYKHFSPLAKRALAEQKNGKKWF